LISCIPQTKDIIMTRPRRSVTTQAQAISRRRLNAQERHERQPHQAQRAIEALRQARDALGVPKDLVIEIEGRLRAQKKRLGNLFARMFPTLFGGIHASALTRTRGWDTPLPSRLLGAWPKRAWLTRLRQLGHDVLVALWRHIETRRDATRRRWPWTWVLDDAVLRTYRSPLEWVGTGWRGQHQRVGEGMDGVRRLGVLGAGPLGVPVDCAGRRPHPNGPGRRGRPKRGWAQGRLAQRLAAWRRRGLNLPAPLVVAESWGSDSTWMAPGAHPHQGPFWGQGKAT
jgi:hypothetical protein